MPAPAERWEEELMLVQAEMQRVVLFYQWKARDWDSRGRTRTLTTFGDSVSRKKYMDALESYDARQANTYSRMAQNCARSWRNHLKVYGLPDPWASEYPLAADEVTQFNKIEARFQRNQAQKARRQAEDDEFEMGIENKEFIWDEREDVPVEGRLDRQ